MSEVRTITPEELRMAFRQAIKNLERYAKSVGVDLEPEPQLIQGYTAEQWQEIIDGGYLCEFSDYHGFPEKNLKMLVKVQNSGQFKASQGGQYLCCRPAQIKGVMRPIFVEPVDDSVMCCFFSGSGFPLHNMRSRCSWGHYKISGDEFSDATSYIEL